MFTEFNILKYENIIYIERLLKELSHRKKKKL